MGGDDTYVLNAEGDTIIEAINAGHDKVETAIDVLQLADNVEDLASTGTSLALYGNSLDNRITGDIGDNILDGGSGSDTLEGGAGDDIYYVNSPNDVIVETTGNGNGNDVVWVASSYALNDSGNNAIEELRSSSNFGVQLTGNSLNNRLLEGEGDDTLVGGAGTDTLDGGAGADTMMGGQGDDIYTVDNIGDVVTEVTGAGNDTVRSFVTNYTLSDNVENLQLLGTSMGGTGNSLDNLLTGNIGINSLSGGAGNDTLEGGGGGDWSVAWVRIPSCSARPTCIR